MKIIQKILTIVLVIVFVLSVLVAGGLFWTFNFGDCKDGCESGMAYLFFLPALTIAGVTGVAVVGLVIAARRGRSANSSSRS